MFRLSTLPPPPSLEHVYTNERRLCTVVCRYVSLSVYQHPSLPCISSPGQPSSVRPLVYSAGENQGEDQKALPMLSFILVVYVCALFAHISSGGCKQSNKCSRRLLARSHLRHGAASLRFILFKAHAWEEQWMTSGIWRSQFFCLELELKKNPPAQHSHCNIIVRTKLN